MPTYRAPVDDFRFILTELYDASRLTAYKEYADVTPDLMMSIVEEAGKFQHGDGVEGGGTLLPTESGLVTRGEARGGVRLSCQVKVKQNMKIHLDEAIFRLAPKRFRRETIIPARRSGMALWRERLFSVMARNAQSATAYFRLPPNRVVELGMQVEI